MTPAPEPSAAPLVAVRLATTYDDVTRRFDIGLGGAESVVVASPATRTPSGDPLAPEVFATPRLWPVLRDLLPPLDVLRADPAGRPWPLSTATPGTETAASRLAIDARAFVAVTTVVDDRVVVRSWLATDEALWAVQPDADVALAPAPTGALADLLVWDVTAALETLARRSERAS